MGILKRCILCVLCMALCISFLACCNGKNESLSVKEITDLVKGYNSNDIVWTALKTDTIPAYFGFDNSDITDISAYINDDDEHYDLIAAIEFKTKDAMLSVIEPLNKSLTAAEISFKNINVAEGQKIANKLLLKNGSTLVIVISSNYEKIKDELAKYDFVSVEK